MDFCSFLFLFSLGSYLQKAIPEVADEHQLVTDWRGTGKWEEQLKRCRNHGAEDLLP